MATMARTLLRAMRKHQRLILIIVIVLFILLVILGFRMSPDQTWRPPGVNRQAQGK